MPPVPINRARLTTFKGFLQAHVDDVVTVSTISSMFSVRTKEKHQIDRFEVSIKRVTKGLVCVVWVNASLKQVCDSIGRQVCS